MVRPDLFMFCQGIREMCKMVEVEKDNAKTLNASIVNPSAHVTSDEVPYSVFKVLNVKSS